MAVMTSNVKGKVGIFSYIFNNIFSGHNIFDGLYDYISVLFRLLPIEFTRNKIIERKTLSDFVHRYTVGLCYNRIMNAMERLLYNAVELLLVFTLFMVLAKIKQIHSF